MQLGGLRERCKLPSGSGRCPATNDFGAFWAFRNLLSAISNIAYFSDTGVCTHPTHLVCLRHWPTVSFPYVPWSSSSVGCGVHSMPPWHLLSSDATASEFQRPVWHVRGEVLSDKMFVVQCFCGRFLRQSFFVILLCVVVPFAVHRFFT